MSEVINFEDGWMVVKRSGFDLVISKLESQADVVMSKEELCHLYSTVYRMCTQPLPHNWSGKLYYTAIDQFKDICENNILPRLQQTSSHDLIAVLVEEWDKHLRLLKTLKVVLGYLDRFFVKRLALLSVQGAGIKAFHDFVFEPCKEKITKALLLMVSQDRRHSDADLSLLRDAIKIYIDIGQGSIDVYEKEWECAFLNDTETFMKKESENWLAVSTCPQYLYKARAQIKAENTRVDMYLHESTRTKLTKLSERRLVGEHLESILNMDSGCQHLLENDNEEVLSVMFLLLKKVPNGLVPMAAILRQYLQNSGMLLLKEPKYENQWDNKLEDTLVSRIVSMHQKYKGVLHRCFSEHNTFHRALKDGFEFFMNKPLPQVQNKRRNTLAMSELLSDYIDRMLRKKPNQMAPVSPSIMEELGFMTPRTETVLERNLSVTIEVFAYISEKDVFAQFYRRHLAKRLILGRSSSDDAEKIVINTLKQVCGVPFVSKFTGMMKDLLLAKDLQTDFERFQKENSKRTDYALSTKALTSGYWPSYKEESISKLPAELEQGISIFTEFYNTRTAHRNLTWVHSLGSVVMESTLRDGSKLDIVVNTIQASILLLFNISQESMKDLQFNIQDIATTLGTSDNVVAKNLMPMVKGKYPLFEESEDGAFKFNWSFKTKSRRIRIPMLPMLKSIESQDDRIASMKSVSEERKHSIEASVVRVMKSKGKLKYLEIVTSVTEALLPFFQPDRKQIRQGVNDLVERDYIEQDESDPNTYLYVA